MTLNIFKTIQRFRKNRKGFSLIEISVVILIIGVLIAGISQASDMIDDAALKGARTASKGSRVGRIKDLVLWLDATSDGASLTALNKQAVDSETVTQLKDLNPRSSAKLTLTGNSIFNSNKVSGLPGLNLNGSVFFKLTDRFDNSTIDYTIYLVYQPLGLPSSGNTQVIFEKRSSEGATFPYRLEIDSNGFYKFSDSTGAAFGAKKASTGKVNIIRLNRSSSANLTILVDDVPQAIVGTGGTSAINTDELIIGAKNAATPTNHANGRLGELIIYERDLAVSEKADIETYLFKKWKIEKDATKAGVCSTSTVANSVGTMAVGATSFSCLPGYAYTQPGAAPGCSGAPNLTFTNTGNATCAQSHCFVLPSLKVTQTMVLPGTGISLTCKNGGTNPSSCTCSSSNWTITCTITGSCT